jgi:hypothetical protein
MESDDLGRLWRAQTEELVERTEVRLTARTEARSLLGRFRGLLILELVTGLATCLLAGSFVADELETAHLAIAGAVLLAAGVAQVIASATQLSLLERVDHAAPVLALQRELERLKVRRIRHLRTAFAVGLVGWVAFGVVAMQVVFGVDLVVMLGAWWVALNVAVGALLVPVFHWLSGQLEWFASLREDLVGRSLEEALATLEELARFERDPA